MIGDGTSAASQRGLPIPQRARAMSTSSSNGQLRFIGNATVHVQWGGLNLLTDPNFIHAHERLEIAPGIKAERLLDPAAQLDELPTIDLVVLSHFHADHFDAVAERDLPKDTPILTPPSAVSQLEERGFTAAYGLETWASSEVALGGHQVRVTAVPGRHGPPLVDLVLPDVMGTVWDLTGPDGSVRLYVSGDTLVFDDLHQIPARFGGIDLGLFHLGGTKVGGLMVTMDGAMGVDAVRIIKPAVAVPIHYEDYDRFTSPLSDFLDRVRDAGLADRVQIVGRGETIALEPRSPAAVRSGGGLAAASPAGG
jgi:L-ascorbate metabolism protein UlaG (beta-lactamase superfamily)